MTSRIRNIWLYSDPEIRAGEAAETTVALARHHAAKLAIVGVLETSDEPFLDTPVGRDLRRLLREDKQQRLDALKEAASRDLPPESVRTALYEGEVAWHTLTAHALAELPDLIVVSGDENAPAGAYGSLGMHLFRKCPVPVLAVQGATGPRPILIAVNPGTADSDERALSIEVMRVTTRLFAGTGSEIHLVHSWDLLGEPLIASRYGRKTVESFFDLQRTYARDHTDQLLAEAGTPRERIAGIHFPKGAPGVVVPALAEELNAGIVILGSAARRGLEGLFIASVAESILTNLRRSALVIKRPGFKSPVPAAR